MSKPTPRVVPSDDCEVSIDGETFCPHEGETVTVFVGQSVSMLRALRVFTEMGPRLLAAEGEPDENDQKLRTLDEAFHDACTLIAERLVDWTWTDDAGRPLPKPDGTPEPIARLRAEEIYWLLRAIRGETPTERGKGSRRSRTTSSASA